MTGHSPTRGSALLIVLVMLGLVAALASVIGRVASGTSVDLATAVNLDRVMIAADGGVALAGALVAAMANSDEEAGAGVGGQTVRLDGMTLSVSLTNERGRIDLNGSPPELLEGLFRALGVPGETARTLAARIVDFRDSDDEAEIGGAEAPAYAQAGLSGPRNGPFVHPFELVAVLGIDDCRNELLARDLGRRQNTPAKHVHLLLMLALAPARSFA